MVAHDGASISIQFSSLITTLFNLFDSKLWILIPPAYCHPNRLDKKVTRIYTNNPSPIHSLIRSQRLIWNISCPLTCQATVVLDWFLKLAKSDVTNDTNCRYSKRSISKVPPVKYAVILLERYFVKCRLKCDWRAANCLINSHQYTMLMSYPT